MDAELAPPSPPPSVVGSTPTFDGRVAEQPGGFMMATPMPFIRASPLAAKPKEVQIRLFPGYYDVHVTSINGEKGFYRLPMQIAGKNGMVMANLATCSIGHLTKRDEQAASLLLKAPLSFDDASHLLLLDDQAPSEVPLAPSPFRRSPRLAALEAPSFISILDKATERKKLKLEGGSGKRLLKGELPGVELLEIATEGCDPLAPTDISQQAIACGVDPATVHSEETKLAEISTFKAASFLPPQCHSFLCCPSAGASGGILTPWNDSDWECSIARLAFSLSCLFSSRASNLSFCVSNVYGPCEAADKQVFFDELANISLQSVGPWAVLNDFNLTLCSSDRSNANLNASEAARFVSCLSSLQLLEIPLLGRSFTWSNQQESPILVRLDRMFVNLDRSSCFPNSTLSFLPRSTSDHVPLVLSVSSDIPMPSTAPEKVSSGGPVYTPVAVTRTATKPAPRVLTSTGGGDDTCHRC
ncbi:hypothetical protein BRADI_4g23684v3 [Brachypodium distachyon]|uniref:Endonuclease/exonuclease/phosphatase domain-containing protein n=1 Tax=Brachypodium distachyon TaxID=15368 RepID=A0A2K2CPS4_BRADI|nr:hypothetical protein BRADI_4g23684v3 [Brachypodium distachyon]